MRQTVVRYLFQLLEGKQVSKQLSIKCAVDFFCNEASPSISCRQTMLLDCEQSYLFYKLFIIFSKFFEQKYFCDIFSKIVNFTPTKKAGVNEAM